jgi:hypothetical protein
MGRGEDERGRRQRWCERDYWTAPIALSNRPDPLELEGDVP